MPMGQKTFDVQKVVDRVQERSDKGELNFSFFLTFFVKFGILCGMKREQSDLLEVVNSPYKEGFETSHEHLP